MIRFWSCVLVLSLGLATIPATGLSEDGPILILAVLSEAPTDPDKLRAQVLVKGRLFESVLFPTESVNRNPMWSKLEMCQGMKANGRPVTDGYRIIDFRVLGASMLPMALQGVAGDCFMKKALEYAPLVEQ